MPLPAAIEAAHRLLMRRFGPISLLVVSAGCLLLAPLAMPESYSWIEHGVSESGAQGVPNAWIARVGFALFGVAVLWQTKRCARLWQQPGTIFLACFGLSMFGVAAFSARSWETATAWDSTEDSLHSLFATTVGISFIGGLVSVIVANAMTIDQPEPTRLASVRKALTARDVIPLGIACIVPLTMSSSAWGLLQRAMFVGAYVWFAAEASTALEPNEKGSGRFHRVGK